MTRGSKSSAAVGTGANKAQSHHPTHMKDWLGHLESLIAAMGGQALAGAGIVSHRQAVTKAEAEYDKFKMQLDAGSNEVERAYLDTIKRAKREVDGAGES